MKLMEVRCCCQPQKLLGYLPVIEGQTRMRYVLRPTEPDDGQRFQQIELRLGAFNDARMNEAGDVVRDTHLALKAEDIPIEVLRRIPSFVEAR